jgi:hypothetical protein
MLGTSMGVNFATYAFVRTPHVPYGIRHVPFFEALAGLGDECDPAWTPLQAGLLVLRLVDGWLEEGSRAAQTTPRGIRAVRAAVRQIDRTDPNRRPLARLVLTVGAATRARRRRRRRSTRDVLAIAPWLLDYGRSLGLSGWPALAADVYETALSHLAFADQPDLVIDTNLRLGSVARTAGDLAGATLAYERAATLTAATGDVLGALRAEAGTAALAVTDAPTARHGRDSLRYALATLFFDLGVDTAARDAFLVLATTADQLYVRWLATQALAASRLSVAGARITLPRPTALADRLAEIAASDQK